MGLLLSELKSKLNSRYVVLSNIDIDSFVPVL